MSAFRAWRLWSDTKPGPIFIPTPVQIASYVEHLSKGRPTAAQGAIGLLGWIARRTGLNLQTDHPLVMLALGILLILYTLYKFNQLR